MPLQFKNDVKKLPKWAQNKISNLEGSLKRCRQKLREMKSGKSDIWIKDYVDGDVYLPKGSHIVFKIDKDRELEINLGEDTGTDEKGVSICAHSNKSKIKMRPQVSNTIWVGIEDKY